MRSMCRHRRRVGLARLAKNLQIADTAMGCCLPVVAVTTCLHTPPSSAVVWLSSPGPLRQSTFFPSSR